MKNKKIVYLISFSILFILVLFVIFYYLNLSRVDNAVSNDKKDLSRELVGEWIADGTQTQVLLEILEDGTEVFADDYSKPYILNIKDDDTYYINFNNKNGEESGTYSIYDNEIIFRPDNNKRVLWHCSFEGNQKLSNCMYADSFSKIK